MKFIPLSASASDALRTAIALIALAVAANVIAQDNSARRGTSPTIIGRWDVTVQDADGVYPSWFEVRQSGTRTLVGSYVGRFGSARPISKVEFDKDTMRFTVPPQWERRQSDIVYEGRLDGEVIRGQTSGDGGESLRWEARRAPALDREPPDRWGDPVELFNGRDLAGWKPRHDGIKNGWQLQSGVLTNAEPGNDLVTEQKFNDFKLHAEFRYPLGSNSGIYLRGRYEAQIEDNFGAEADSHRIGGIYGFLMPRINAARAAGQWQSLDLTLIGRRVTITLNDELVVDRQIIPGITGGALDSDEGKPGPIMIQGDHGPVEFRKLTLTQAGENSPAATR